MDEDEAYATWMKACEQIDKWSQHPDSGFARQQVAMWRKIQHANRWWQPGASSGAARRDDDDNDDV